MEKYIKIKRRNKRTIIMAYVKKQQGFSLVEIMVAVLIGLIVLAGLISVFDLSSRMNRTQNGLARIQENGRFAMMTLQQNVSQAAYQYCNSESRMPSPPDERSFKLPWNLVDLNVADRIRLSGVNPMPYLDPARLVHGHECDQNGVCTPALNSTGSDPIVAGLTAGVADTNRVTGTDILTIRYLRDLGRNFSPEFGREVSGVVAPNRINFSARSTATPPVPMPSPGSGFLLINCPTTGVFSNVYGKNLQSAFADHYVMASAQMPSMQYDQSPRLFDIASDFVTATFYVANRIVDGRSIPTLFQSINGISQPLIEGVDDFDVTYVVKDRSGVISYLTADLVQNMPAGNCVQLQPLDGVAPLTNLGCGWRSVVAVEVHLLLNTIYNSSTNPNEQFLYSEYGINYVTPAAIQSAIPHYDMHRKEFYTTISLKNTLR